MPFRTFPSNVPSIPETKGQSTFNDKIIKEQQSIHVCNQEIPPEPKKLIATAKRKKKNEEDAKNYSELKKSQTYYQMQINGEKIFSYQIFISLRHYDKPNTNIFDIVLYFSSILEMNWKLITRQKF